MNRFERTVRRVDAFQQRHRGTSFAFGLVQKYGNDNGGALGIDQGERELIGRLPPSIRAAAPYSS